LVGGVGGDKLSIIFEEATHPVPPQVVDYLGATEKVKNLAIQGL
jgi:hypothetical protein